MMTPRNAPSEVIALPPKRRCADTLLLAASNSAWRDAMHGQQRNVVLGTMEKTESAGRQPHPWKMPIEKDMAI